MTNLKNVKPLIVDHPPIIQQQFHAQLQMFGRIDVFGHDVVVCSVQKQFAEELYGLAFYNVVFALNEHVVVFVEELVEVCLEVGRYHILVLDEDFLWNRVRVDRDGKEFKLTRNVLKASVQTSKLLLTIQSKNFQNVPSPLLAFAVSTSAKFAAFPSGLGSSYSISAATASYFKASLSTPPHGIALSLHSYPLQSDITI
jgi:hypothetical protein